MRATRLIVVGVLACVLILLGAGQFSALPRLLLEHLGGPELDSNHPLRDSEGRRRVALPVNPLVCRMADIRRPFNRTLWTVESLMPNGAAAFCAQFGEPARPANATPRLVYNIMFGGESDMLEVALHEIYPVVDIIFLTESAITHSLQQRTPVWLTRFKLEPRFKPFLEKIDHQVYTSRRFDKWVEFDRKRKLYEARYHRKVVIRGRVIDDKMRPITGWEVERNQRKFFLKFLDLHNVTIKDLIIANSDLDEIFSRELLVRYKYCNTSLDFRTFHFRYDLNCLQETVVSQQANLVFFAPPKNDFSDIDLFKRRAGHVNAAFDPVNLMTEMRKGRLVWHLTAFGGADAVLKKYENSPHRFVGKLTREDVSRDIMTCAYNDKQRDRVDLTPDLLPYFIAQNQCQFRAMGWLRPSTL